MLVIVVVSSRKAGVKQLQSTAERKLSIPHCLRVKLHWHP